MKTTVQKCPCRENQGSALKFGAILKDDLGYLPIDDLEVDDLPLAEKESRLAVQKPAGFNAVTGAVALGTDRLNGGTFSGIEHFELDSGPVGQFPHGSAHGIDLPDDMSFSDPADRGIAGHLSDQIEMHRDKKGVLPHPGCCIGGFDSGVTSSDDEDIP